MALQTSCPGALRTPSGSRSWKLNVLTLWSVCPTALIQGAGQTWTLSAGSASPAECSWSMFMVMRQDEFKSGSHPAAQPGRISWWAWLFGTHGWSGQAGMGNLQCHWKKDWQPWFELEANPGPQRIEGKLGWAGHSLGRHVGSASLADT